MKNREKSFNETANAYITIQNQFSDCENLSELEEMYKAWQEIVNIQYNRMIAELSSNCMAVKTPTLDKILEIREQTRLCGEFLEWLQGKYAMFELKAQRDNPFYHGTGDYINIEKLLAEFFGINSEEAEKEKAALLEIERNKQKEHHCKLCGKYIEDENLKVCDKCASEYKF